jgi:hypothetical protein
MKTELEIRKALKDAKKRSKKFYPLDSNEEGFTTEQYVGCS